MIVRLMAPFSLRCNACGEVRALPCARLTQQYIYKGKKFNARCVATKVTMRLTMQEGGTSASVLARR